MFIVTFILLLGPVANSNLAQVLLQLLNFAAVIASGLMIWKGLGLVTNSESPIVVVLRCESGVLKYNLGAHIRTIADRWNRPSIVVTSSS